MTGSSPAVCRPLDELPDGTVKIPLNLPHGAVWPVVAQIAALSQRRAGCTASITFLADRLGMHPSTIYEALKAADEWIITDASARITRRYLAPIPDDGAWARISYRAAAGVGCYSVDGQWTPRRNRSALLQLYCRLRRDEAVGRVRSQSELAADCQVTDRTVRAMLAVLEGDGWISGHRAGRMIAYRTHDAPLHVVQANLASGKDAPAEPVDLAGQDPAVKRPRNLSRNDLGKPVESISETDPVQKRDDQAGGEKRDCSPLAVGEVQHRSDDAASALPRERQTSNISRPVSPPRGGALSVMTAIPLSWQLRMSDQDRERVEAAVYREMRRGRTAEQMSARVRRRLTAWYGVLPRRAVAAALTVVERGYRCPRPECEDHLLPSGHPCSACQEIGAQANRHRREGLDAGERTATGARRTVTDPCVTPDRRPRVDLQRRHVQKANRVDADGPDGPAARARALLLATCPRTAATMRAAAARKGQILPEPV
ncbi:hypothetical protein ACFQ0B_76200 [Nonomuraea thailandensis]